jgi:hypothetical protein
MGKWSLDEANELNEYLDRRIDKLTKPIPSAQVLRVAEGVVTAHCEDGESASNYTEEDYNNLLEAYGMLQEYIPGVLTKIRARSIDPNTGWRLHQVTAGQGEVGLCAICKSPYQHFDASAQVQCIDTQNKLFRSVCRECVRNHAPIEFAELEEVHEWLKKVGCGDKDKGHGRNDKYRRIRVIDAIRRIGCEDSITYFQGVTSKASEWAKDSYGEWR